MAFTEAVATSDETGMRVEVEGAFANERHTSPSQVF